MRVYLVGPGLLLENAEFDGLVCVSGWVVNGAWWYRSNGTYGFAYRHFDSDLLEPVNEWAEPNLDFVPVTQLGDNYDLIIGINKDKPVFKGGELDLAKLIIDFNKIRGKREARLETKFGGRFDDYDDDIPF